MHAQGLNVALSQNNHISMQSANSNEDCTKGMVVDLLFVMGGVTVRCQVYVVDNTPWPVLLGHPFTCLLEAVTFDYQDGAQDIQLADACSGKQVLMPRHKRNKSDGAAAAAAEGFGLQTTRHARRNLSLTVRLYPLILYRKHKTQKQVLQLQILDIQTRSLLLQILVVRTLIFKTQRGARSRAAPPTHFRGLRICLCTSHMTTTSACALRLLNSIWRPSTSILAHPSRLTQQAPLHSLWSIKTCLHQQPGLLTQSLGRANTNLLRRRSSRYLQCCQKSFASSDITHTTRWTPFLSYCITHPILSPASISHRNPSSL
jgi:hypothetical protein